MKRRVGVLFLCALICLFSSCGQEKDEEKRLLDALCTRQDCTVYDLSGVYGKKPEENFLKAVFDDEKALLHLSLFEDCLLVFGKGEDGYQIFLCKIRHPSEAPRGEALLRRRMELLQKADVRRYMREDYESCLFSAQVYGNGNWLFLLATGENDLVREKIKGIL